MARRQRGAHCAAISRPAPSPPHRRMRSIVVPLDGSALAESALPVASAIARRSSGVLRTTSVRWPDLPGALTHPGVPADLVVLAPPDESDTSRIRLGRVASELARDLEVPVLVMGPSLVGSVPGVFRRVLVPLDGSASCELVLDDVLRVVGSRDVEFTLLRIVAPLHPLVRAVVSQARIEHDAHVERARAEEELEAAVSRCAGRGLVARWEIREDLRPERGIVAFAHEMDADLIALTTHARGRMGRFLLGSVAPAVVRYASSPVLLRHVSDELDEIFPGLGPAALRS